VGSTRARVVALAFAAVAFAACGCFNSHNPGYFPYYLPGGRIQQEHAKPRLGVFSDFDPKACKLEVVPMNPSAPLGSQMVLVASVLDKDGNPRRSRRVEWMIEGPGQIIEVDEAGVYAGRGYKVDSHYAVSYTGYTSHKITRGNDNPADDVEIAAGQTFCVITSAVPGETIVTVYAPGVFNWSQGRVVSRICWGEGRFKFPEPTAARSGGELILTTSVNRLDQDGPGPLPNYHVRYRVLDSDADNSAVLVPKSTSGTTVAMSGANAKEADAAVGTDGTAAVRLVQRDPKPGMTRIAIEVVKPPENGVGAGSVVARRETTVEWSAPSVQLNVSTPQATGNAGTFKSTVSLQNVGPIDSREAVVRVTLSDGATLARSEPPPVKVEGGAYLFDVPPVAVKKSQDIVLEVKPAKVGPVTVTAEAATVDGLKAENRATTQIESGKLNVHVEAPATALAGERIPVKVAITNSSSVAAEHVTVWARFDDSLSHPSNQNPVELTAGKLAPGETKLLDVPLTAKAAGRYGVRASATADGNVAANSAPVAFDVRRAELKLAATGPKLIYLDQEFTWTVSVANTGEAPVANVVVRSTLPAEVKVTSAGEGKVGPGSVEWKVGEMKAGEQRNFSLTAVAGKLTDRATLSVVALGDALGLQPGTSRPVGDPLEVKAESTVAIAGVPALSLEVATPQGLIDTGKRVTFQVRVKNKGTVSARDIEVLAYAPPEFKTLRGTGPTSATVLPDGSVKFGKVEEVRPGETVTFTVEIEAIKVGDARIRAEVKAAHLTNTLKEEQSTRVVSGR
jgi:uncharacterized repeat protein (TIGR01451 family)